LKLIEKELTMSIEQNMNMQELREEEYTKVYAGIRNPCFVEEELMTILPEVPTPPSGHKIDL
tara:strand:+ start:259 stop:444 length:186 start_codon:yes stop_codon:yes gene_type:complete